MVVRKRWLKIWQQTLEQNSMEYNTEMNNHRFIIIKFWKGKMIIEDLIAVSGQWKQEL